MARNPVPMTPNRFSRLRFNPSRRVIIQPAYWHDISASEMGRTVKPGDEGADMVYIPNVGLQLRSKNPNAGKSYEGEPVVMPGTWAEGFLAKNYRRREALDGVTYGEGSETGFELRQKAIAAGGSWEKRLVADQGAFPGPDHDAITDLDRVFVSSSAHEPNQSVDFSVHLPQTNLSAYGEVARCYFSGPASKHLTWTGLGQYCMAITGQRLVNVYERGSYSQDTPTWKRVHSFQVESSSNSFIHFKVTSDCTDNCSGQWTGSAISIQTAQFPARWLGHPNDPSTPDAPIGRGAWSLNLAKAVQKTTINIKVAGDAPCTPIAARMDIRRDVRAAANVFRPDVEDEGFAYLNWIPIPFVPIVASPPVPFVVEVYSDRPSGTTVTVTATNSQTDEPYDLTEFTPENASDCRVQYYRLFPKSSDQLRYLTLKIEVTGGERTPTIRRVIIWRDPVTTVPTTESVDWPLQRPTPALPDRVISSVSINGQTDTPESASAVFKIADFSGNEGRVKFRTGTYIEYAVLASNGDVRSKLFTGIISSLTSQRIAGHDPRYPNRWPAPAAWKGEVQCVSPIADAKSRLAPGRVNLWDQIENRPMTVSGAVYELCAAANELGAIIPSAPQRLFGLGENDLSIETSTPTMEIAEELWQDYTGGVLIFDDNAVNNGFDGVPRFLKRPKPPYRPLMVFDPYHPLDREILQGGTPTGGKLGWKEGAYGTLDIDGRDVPIYPMGRARLIVTPPEASMVIVIGGGISGVKGDQGGQLIQFAVNVGSVNLFGLGSGHASYPDPFNQDALNRLVIVEVRDATLSSPEQVNFVTRRVYDAACFARETYRFTTIVPLLPASLTGDSYQVRERQPRVGDVAAVRLADGSLRTYIVTDCKIQFRKSAFMTCEIELTRTSRIGTYGVPIGAMNMYKVAKRSRDKALLGAGYTRRSARFHQQRMASDLRSLWTGLPAQYMEPIQNLDPSSASFGEFYPMAGYD